MSKKDIYRSVALDAETDRMLLRLARKHDDNRSLVIRELIRKAAQGEAPYASELRELQDRER